MKQLSRWLKATSLLMASSLIFAPSAIVAETTHYVQSGDTLSGIATSYGVTIEDIIAWNNLSSVYVPVGTALYLENTNTSYNPYDRSHGQSAVYDQGINDWIGFYDNSNYAAVTSSPTTNGYYHTIQVGDTLWDLATYNGTTVDAIKSANGLASDWVTVGTNIFIPNGYGYTSYEQNTYTEGKIVDSTVDPIEDSSVSTETSENNIDVIDLTHIPEDLRPKTYTIQSGDNVWLIAKKHNISAESLRLWNDLEDADNTLTIGQVLYVSNPAFVPLTHKIQVGDTLDSIASDYGTTAENIEAWNKLSSFETLSVGDFLMVSNPKPAVHQVDPKETLESISEKYDITVDQLKEWNLLPEESVLVNALLIVSDPTQATP